MPTFNYKYSVELWICTLLMKCYKSHFPNTDSVNNREKDTNIYSQTADFSLPLQLISYY